MSRKRMTWVIDSRKFAKKVKGVCINNTDGNSLPDDEDGAEICQACGQPKPPEGGNVAPQEWIGLPAGVKFDPNDKEILDHLAAKIGLNGSKPHVLLDEFIPTLEGDDGICYTHPERLPGVKNDGRSNHFFHRPANAYTKGNRKRRKVSTGEDDGVGETRWHKTGKTRPVVENGEQIGWKKIMVLYTNFKRKAKPKKTNWVMHQYHLGDDEDERDGELVVSKVFYQTQPRSTLCRKTTDSDDDDEEFAEAPSVQTEQKTSGERVTRLSKPVPSTPEVVRPCPSREARFDILPHLRSTTEVSLNARTPDSTLSCVKCPTNCASNNPFADIMVDDCKGEDLLCDENLLDGSVLEDLDVDSSQQFRSFAEGLSIPFDEEHASPDWNGLEDIFGLTNMEPITSQEMREWLTPVHVTSLQDAKEMDVQPVNDQAVGLESQLPWY